MARGTKAERWILALTLGVAVLLFLGALLMVILVPPA
ncbi:MAG: hypothetical protein BWY06_00866 [Candidatus Latescibacteria bacterium ADurb.Bin168]|nr:MAG: hypothetical protein BWY06_00866 [Candidatus Latescibacteria bacterium ADurb.Bin168]